jgi:hypothetical protein
MSVVEVCGERLLWFEYVLSLQAQVLNACSLASGPILGVYGNFRWDLVGWTSRSLEVCL